MEQLVVEIGRWSSALFEVVGIGVIVGGFFIATVRSLARLKEPNGTSAAYQTMRSIFGRSVLLGLEILVAADIINTVAVDPTLDSLLVLGLLVLIRTFLSFALDVELEGSWPWRKRELEDREMTDHIERKGL